MLMFSAAAHRHIVASYIRSNIFFPQLRFAFILALGREVNVGFLTELRDGLEIDRKADVCTILAAADRLHRNYEVTSVLPTNAERVFQELEKSVQVFRRFLKQVDSSLGSEFYCQDEYASWLMNTSFRMWKVATARAFTDRHLRFVSDPATPGPKYPVRKVTPDKSSTLEVLRGLLYDRCADDRDRAFVTGLEKEIVHPLTVMRTAIVGEVVAPSESHDHPRACAQESPYIPHAEVRRE